MLNKFSGLLAPINGEELYLSLGCSHTVAFCKLAPLGGPTPIKELQDANGNVDYGKICKQADFKHMIEQGWDWDTLFAADSVTPRKARRMSRGALNTMRMISHSMEIEVPLVGNTHLIQVLKPVSAKDALYVESEANTLSVVFQFLMESGFAPEDAIRKLNHDGEKGVQMMNDCKFLVKKQLGKHNSQIVPTLWDETYRMDDRPAMMRLPHCSAQALAAILKAIKDNGMPEGGTSLATQTPWGKTLQTISVTDKDDAALLWVASSDKPWRLVAYTDEVTTGHPLHATA